LPISRQSNGYFQSTTRVWTRNYCYVAEIEINAATYGRDLKSCLYSGVFADSQIAWLFEVFLILDLLMSNPLNLTPGQKYRIIKPFTDYDRALHKVGQCWTFVETHFLPYEDGLTVMVRLDGNPTTLAFRLQWRPEQQADIINNFLDYVEPVDK
jgi:hypothetical protein